MSFNGIPWTNWSEIVAVAVCLYAFCFKLNRQVIANRLKFINRRRWNAFVAVVVILVSLKATTFFVSPTAGEFEVCYVNTDQTLENGCIRTFEPLPLIASSSQEFDRRSTSTDRIIFQPLKAPASGITQTNWRLPFINSRKFDEGWRTWNSDDKNIEIFPFRAYFRGQVKFSDEETLRIRYVGEGKVAVNDKEIRLPPSYKNEQTLNLDIGAGHKQVEVDYHFLRTETYGEPSNLPYATLVLESKKDNFIRPTTPTIPLMYELLFRILDIAICGVLILLLCALRAKIRDLAVAVSIGTAVALAIAIGSVAIVKRLMPLELSVIILTVFIVVGMQKSWNPSRLFFGVLGVAISLVLNEVKFVLDRSPNVDQILIRLRGNDHLVYHAHVREMLESGFLRGGEDVYHFQPGIRYYFYLQNVLFGESSLITGCVSVALMGWGIWFVAVRLKSPLVLVRRLQMLGIVALIVWWSSSHTTQSSVFGLSEFGAWIGALYIFGLMLGETCDKQIATVAALAGVVTWIRPNQGLAMLGIICCAGLLQVSCQNVRGRRTVIGIGVFSLVLSLIPVHNFVFGNVVAFQPTGAIAASQLSWGQLLSVANDADAQAFLINNLKAAIYLPTFLPDIYSHRLALALLMFWIVIAVAFGVWLRTKQCVLYSGIFALVIGGQIAPFLKYNIVRYHPIQIVAIHLSAILIVLYLTSHTFLKREVSKPDSGRCEGSVRQMN
jgi:hypothetical protein